MKLFLAEDDPILSDALLTSLSQAGFKVSHATNGTDAEARLIGEDFDAAVLDIGLPGIDGLTVLRAVRALKPNLPILLLTALDGVEDRVAGLNAGADDYLPKPFDFSELEARLNALMRRSKSLQPDITTIANLRLDRVGQRAWAGEVPLVLSARELEVLDVLVTQRDRVVPKEQIVSLLAPEGGDLGANAIEVYVHRLRKKLEPCGVEICTVRGLGYLLQQRKSQPEQSDATAV
ncbi:response regulator transcription factor [Parachitinimonas caeni]|uniref:Response regulator transcription factor n=1 Tax=Parachitinimonas caeni TaxID=3031301 RepID=A0ABT7DZ91_9NEIS|nr:response regulator transcription factor [Parachitinimonas caeni]MDK2125368.1 response regulator transcription factor [Parachitinimonas caeni]